MANKVADVSQHILDNIGGAGNIASFSHCATRLRFQLNDRSQADLEAIDAEPAVLGVVPQGDNGLQVIMGGDVANYYQGITALPGVSGEKSEGAQSKKEYGGVRGKYSFVDYAFEVLSDTFRPVLWALLGASLIITLLVLADQFGIQAFDPPEGESLPPTWQFMHAMWRSVFYFLPIMVGATAARKLGANEWIGAAIPAALMTPEFLALGGQGDTVTVFGLPMVLNSYGGQVFPPLFAAVVLSFVEKGLKKIIPSAVQMVFVPFLSLLIMIPLTAFLVGPFGIGVGRGISEGLLAVNDFSPFILAIIVPLIYPFMVPLGLHWPLNAIMIQNIATLGYDFIQGPMGAWNFACFGVITGVFVQALRDRDRAMRQVASGGMFAGLLGGISEPSLYGVLLRYRKSYVRLLPGCLAGGVVMGLFSVKAKAFVFTSLLTIPAFDPLGGYALGIAVAFFTSFFLVFFFDYRTQEEKEEALAKVAADDAAAAAEQDAEAPAAAAPVAAAAAAGGTATAVATKPVTGTLTETFELTAPLSGRVIPLGSVEDPGFASGAVGHGVAILPDGDTVVAPAAGTIMVAHGTGHAVGLKLDNGVQLLVHVGIDTVKMDGDGFEMLVAKGDRVEAGQPLITFDPVKIVAAGYPLTTPVLVSNYKKLGPVEAKLSGHAAVGDVVATVAPKTAE